MKIHRFIAPLTYTEKTLVIRDPELVHQIHRVLRLTAGEQVLFGDGSGKEAHTVLTTVSKSLVEAEILSFSQNENEPAKSVTLYVALLKKDNFELAIQKAVESGVSRIVPLLTQRTVKIGLNEERIKSIIKEAAEQSGRGILPILESPQPFAEALEKMDPKNTVFFDLGGNELTNEESEKATALCIGPEGGFTPEEHSLAEHHGCQIRNLGKLTLRGETAAIVGSYRIVHGI